MARELWLLAGGNGAGKSTFHRHFLEPRGLAFVNADVIAHRLDPERPEAASYEAAQEAMHRFRELLSRGVSFCYETVFSHPSKLDMLSSAKAAGYRVVLVYVHLERDELNLARVRQRVDEGGHDVPAAKIVSRVPRTLGHMREAVHLADRTLLYDNSSDAEPFVLVADKRDAQVRVPKEPLPGWAVEILTGAAPAT